jgi:hypothetical protein
MWVKDKRWLIVCGCEAKACERLGLKVSFLKGQERGEKWI